MLPPSLDMRDFVSFQSFPPGFNFIPISLVSHESFLSCLCPIVSPLICITLIASPFDKMLQSLRFTPQHRTVSGWKLIRRESFNTHNLSALSNKQTSTNCRYRFH